MNDDFWKELLKLDAMGMNVTGGRLKPELEARKQGNDLAASDSKLSTDVSNPPQPSETTQ